jgi:hypothetical protein
VAHPPQARAQASMPQAPPPPGDQQAPPQKKGLFRRLLDVFK